MLDTGLKVYAVPLQPLEWPSGQCHWLSKIYMKRLSVIQASYAVLPQLLLSLEVVYYRMDTY